MTYHIPIYKSINSRYCCRCTYLPTRYYACNFCMSRDVFLIKSRKNKHAKLEFSPSGSTLSVLNILKTTNEFILETWTFYTSRYYTSVSDMKFTLIMLPVSKKRAITMASSQRSRPLRLQLR